jgi:hypothetical protein
MVEFISDIMITGFVGYYFLWKPFKFIYFYITGVDLGRKLSGKKSWER